MKPELPNPREEIEAKLTALLLGELPANDAFALGRAIEQDPELAKLYVRLNETLGFVRETVVNEKQEQPGETPPLKLSKPRREKLLAHFKTVKPAQFNIPKRQTRHWVLEIAAMGAVILLVISVSVPNFTKSRATSTSNAIINNLRQLDGAKQQWALENHKSENDQPTMANLEPYLKGGLASVSGEKYQVGKVGEPDLADLNTPRGSKSITLSANGVVAFGGGRTEGMGITRLPPGGAPNQVETSKTPNVTGDLGWVGVLEKPVTLAANDGKSASITEPGRAKMNPIALPYQIAAQESPDTSSVEIAGKDFGYQQNSPAFSTQPSGRPAAAVELTGITTITRQKQLLTPIPEKNASDFLFGGKLKQTDLSGLTAGSGGGGISSVPGQSADQTAFRQRYGLANASRPASAPAEPVASPIPAPVDPTTGLPLANAVAESESASPIDPATGLPIPMSAPAKSAVAALGAPEGLARESKEFSKSKLDVQATYEGSQGGGGPVAKGRIASPESKTVLTWGDTSTESLAKLKVPMPDDLALFRSESDASKKVDEEKQRFDSKVAANGVDSPASPILRGYDNDASRGPQNLGEENRFSLIDGARNREAQNRRDGNRAFGFDWYLGNQLAKNGTPVDVPAASEVFEFKTANADSSIVPLAPPAPAAVFQFEDVSALNTPGQRKANIADAAGNVELSLASNGRLADKSKNTDFEQSTLVQDGRKLYEAGKLDEASSTFKQALKDDPKNQAAYYYENLINDARYQAAQNHRDATSHQGLVQLEQAWAAPPRRELLPQPNPYARSTALDTSRELITNASTAIPRVQSFDRYTKPGSIEAARTATAQASIPLPSVTSGGALAKSEGAREYANAKQALEKLERFQQLLAMKIAAENIDVELPKTSMVKIADSAIPDSSPPGILGKLRETINGGVHRTARIKIERDQNEIAGMTEKPLSGSYDPYFLQIESEVIQSEKILGKVADDLHLSEVWGRKKGEGTKLSKTETLNAAERESLQRMDEEIRRAHENDAQQANLKRAITNSTAPISQPEVTTGVTPFSTFSLNVSDVSFKLAAASMEKGQMPDPASVRSEEFINAFDYRDPEPAAGVPVAFAFERSRYPFAHNRDLLRFSIKTAAAGRQPGRPLNLVLLLDNSGSMERADRVQIIHEALRVLSAQLQAQDKLSVVTFARTPRLWVDGVAGDQAGKVAEEVSGLTPQGGTNLEEAMHLAYQTAARHYLPNGINRVVVLTDGAANLGDVQPESLKQKVEAQRKQGIALDCFGIGWEGLNDDLLETLSRNGDGRYGFINTPEEAATEFAGQLAGALKVAASDVKVQVEFNPKRVTAYRQIGYAKHQLTKEQFRDNTVDAAEIGAAESGNALYVIEVNEGGEGPLGMVRVRFKIPGTNDYREHEWPVPFNGSAVSLDQASPAMRLAATASALSEWLVSSPYAAEVTPDRLLGYISGMPEVYGADARPKKLEWMIRQAKSVTGK